MPNACLPRHACIWVKVLSLRGLWNTRTDLHARTARYSGFPSMKTRENVDGSVKNDVPSMKIAKNVDGNLENQIPSMKTGKIVDDSVKNDVSSMKTAKIVDGSVRLK